MDVKLRCFALMEFLVDQKRVNVCYHTVKMVPCDSLSKSPGGGIGRMEGK